MKIRVQGNSIRLRLTQTDIQEFDRDKVLTRGVQFPGGPQLQYQIVQTSQSLISVSFNHSTIRVQIPEKDSKKWINSEQVGLRQNVALESGDQLKILIEKDFECLHPRLGEDERDAFPNPKAKDS